MTQPLEKIVESEIFLLLTRFLYGSYNFQLIPYTAYARLQAMRDTQHIYQSADVRRCFSNLSDPLIAKFMQKGLIACLPQQKSLRRVFRYSAIQIAYLGILGQLSLYGVLPRIEQMRVTSPTHEHLTLKEPEQVVDALYELGPDVALMVTLEEFYWKNESSRLRSSVTRAGLNFMKKSNVWAWIELFTKESDNFDEYPDPEQLGFDLFQYGDWSQRFGYLFIDAERIIRHVYKRLKIERLLK